MLGPSEVAFSYQTQFFLAFMMQIPMLYQLYKCRLQLFSNQESVRFCCLVKRLSLFGNKKGSRMVPNRFFSFMTLAGRARSQTMTIIIEQSYLVSTSGNRFLKSNSVPCVWLREKIKPNIFYVTLFILLNHNFMFPLSCKLYDKQTQRSKLSISLNVFL